MTPLNDTRTPDYERSSSRQTGTHSPRKRLDGLQASAAPFHPSTYSGANSDGTGPEPPFQVVGSPMEPSFVPAGVDKDAFLAGERAAMARSLQMLLPSQQAVGALGAGLHRLEQRVQEEASHSRQSHLATADCRSVIQGLTQRLEYLEKIRLPGMDNRIQHAIEAPLSSEFHATLQGLQSALGSISESNANAHYGLTGFAVRQLNWLGTTAVLYTQRAISKADVAAIFLSRKILVDTRVPLAIEGAEAQGPIPREAARSTRAVLAAAMFLAAIEAAWQTHARVLTYVPPRVRKATAPAELGLRILRGATWAATLTLSAVYFRRGCFVVADRAICSADRALKQITSLRPFSSPAFRTPAPASPPHSPGGLEAEGDTEACTPQPAAALEYRPPAHAAGPPVRQRSIFDTPPPSPPV